MAGLKMEGSQITWTTANNTNPQRVARLTLFVPQCHFRAVHALVSPHAPTGCLQPQFLSFFTVTWLGIARNYTSGE